MKAKRPAKVLTRRAAVQGAAVAGAGGLLGCGGKIDGSLTSSAGLSGRPRVAVVGGGAGGISAAYLLDSVYDVDLFESRAKVGGHCDSQLVDYQGHELTVDLGAQFFHPETHPIYVTLLEELGLYDPEQPDADATLEAEGSLCVFRVDRLLPTFSSQRPLLTPFQAIDFLAYTQAARQAVLGNLPWETTLEAWVESLAVSRRFKETILYPWLAATIGTTQQDVKRISARSCLQNFALAYPENITQSPTIYNSSIGLEGNLLSMLELSPNTTVHVSSPIVALVFEDGAWSVQTPLGLHGPYDAVVINAPPHTSKGLLEPLPWATDIAATLDQFEYFDSRLLIHTDAQYVTSQQSFWAAYNAGVDGEECEGSVWYGAIQKLLPGGASIDVFKSWASRRQADPANILFERSFRHPLITPAAIACSRALADVQGLNGLYFSGQFTTGMDLQEAAVYSAMKVADALAPESTALASLRALLELRGRGGISYDL